MSNLGDKFALRFTDASIQLDRFSAKLRNQTLSFLEKLQADLKAEIRRYDLEGIRRTAAKRVRAEKLILEVKRLVDKKYKEMNSLLTHELVKLSEFQQQKTVNLINTVIGANIATATLTATELKVLASKETVLGLPLKDWWESQAQNLQRRFAQEIRLGVVAGESNEALVSRVVGKATGRSTIVYTEAGKATRVREFAGGILDVAKNQARTLVRTSVQSVSNKVLEETYKENDDLIKGMEALVTLDNRTSEICIARAGASWDMEGNPMPKSPYQEPYPGPPPWHPNCRTVIIPITKSWDELLNEAGRKTRKKLDSVPDATRASMDGQVAGSIRTFSDWLKTKGDAFAKEVLGAGRFELWKKGKITLPQLIDQSGRPLSLEELENL